MVNSLDKDVKKGKKSKYYLSALLFVLLLLSMYFSMFTLRKNKLYENVKDWEKIGESYALREDDITYMTSYANPLDLNIRNIPENLSLVADRANDKNSEISLAYHGDDSAVQVMFRSGPIEGMSFVFDSEEFQLSDVAEEDGDIKYSYEIRKYVNEQLSNEHAYLQETFEKVKGKWKEVNGV